VEEEDRRGTNLLLWEVMMGVSVDRGGGDFHTLVHVCILVHTDTQGHIHSIKVKSHMHMHTAAIET